MANQFEDTKKGAAPGAGTDDARSLFGQTHYNAPEEKERWEAPDPDEDDGNPCDPVTMANVAAKIIEDRQLRKALRVCYAKALRADVGLGNAGIYLDSLSGRLCLTDRKYLPWEDRKEDHQEPGAWDEIDYSNALEYFERQYHIVGGMSEERKCLEVSMKNWARNRGACFNPFERLLQSVAVDGSEDPSLLFIKYCGCPDTPYYRELGYRVCMEIVQRGCWGAKDDRVLVLALVGNQGVGKSLLCKRMALKEEWYASLEGVKATSRDEAKMTLLGKIIAELQEGEFLRINGVNACKAFFSNVSDAFRAPFAFAVEPHRRHCLFVITTNEVGVLKDPTGDRRYCVVRFPAWWPDLDDCEEAIDPKTGESIGCIYPKDGKEVSMRGKVFVTPKQLTFGRMAQMLASVYRDIESGKAKGRETFSPEANKEWKAEQASNSSPILAEQELESIRRMLFPIDLAAKWDKATVHEWIQCLSGNAAAAGRIRGAYDDKENPLKSVLSEYDALFGADGKLDPERLKASPYRWGTLRRLAAGVLRQLDPKAEAAQAMAIMERKWGWKKVGTCQMQRWIGTGLFYGVYEADDGLAGAFVPVLADGKDGGEAGNAMSEDADGKESRDAEEGKSKKKLPLPAGYKGLDANPFFKDGGGASKGSPQGNGDGRRP